MSGLQIIETWVICAFIISYQKVTSNWIGLSVQCMSLVPPVLNTVWSVRFSFNLKQTHNAPVQRLIFKYICKRWPFSILFLPRTIKTLADAKSTESLFLGIFKGLNIGVLNKDRHVTLNYQKMESRTKVLLNTPQLSVTWIQSNQKIVLSK